MLRYPRNSRMQTLFTSQEVNHVSCLKLYKVHIPGKLFLMSTPLEESSLAVPLGQWFSAAMYSTFHRFGALFLRSALYLVLQLFLTSMNYPR